MMAASMSTCVHHVSTRDVHAQRPRGSAIDVHRRMAGQRVRPPDAQCNGSRVVHALIAGSMLKCVMILTHLQTYPLSLSIALQRAIY